MNNPVQIQTLKPGDKFKQINQSADSNVWVVIAHLTKGVSFRVEDAPSGTVFAIPKYYYVLPVDNG